MGGSRKADLTQSITFYLSLESNITHTTYCCSVKKKQVTHTNTQLEQHNTRQDKNNTRNDHTKNHPPPLNNDRRWRGDGAQELCPTHRSYCKAARAAMGGSRKADLTELRSKGCAPRKKMALLLRSEKKRLLSELEAALAAIEARSRKAGKPLAAAITS